MYRLERTRRMKLVFGVLALVFAVLVIVGYGYGGDELIHYGFMNEPLAAIGMVVSLVGAVVCLVAFLTVNALEKDIAEWLEILESKINDRK